MGSQLRFVRTQSGGNAVNESISRYPLMIVREFASQVAAPTQTGEVGVDAGIKVERRTDGEVPPEVPNTTARDEEAGPRD